MATNEYVERRDDAYRLVGSRVSLDSIVYGFWNGQTAESIAQSFPTLTLEHIYGALAYYLAHRHDVDAHIARGRDELDALRQRARDADPMFYRKIAETEGGQPTLRP